MDVETNIAEDENQQSVFSLCLRSKKRTLDLFLDNYLTSGSSPSSDEQSLRIKLNTKISTEYGPVKDLPPPQLPGAKSSTPSASKPSKMEQTDNNNLKPLPPTSGLGSVLPQPKTAGPSAERPSAPTSTAIVLTNPNQNAIIRKSQQEEMPLPPSQSRALAISNPYALEKPQWHPPWKLMRVISGHLGWVRTIAVDPSNEWFVTGSADRTIKIWDLASGTLRLTLTGHINTIRGLAISDRRPYLFSCAEDKKVICWDLEQNKAIRHYHGHLSGVYCMALHPTLDILVTGGRDSAVRVWDVRTQAPIHVLTGHNSTVGSVVCQGVDPQIISGSHDSTIKCWDLAKGSCHTTLTHHKKSVRALALHPKEFAMASGSPDNIKHWKFPEIKFMKNFSGHSAIINTLAINQDNVLVSGADNGSMYFWDWRTGYNFQRLQTQVQPGSLDSEAGIFCTTFDQTGARLIVGEADKTIKIYKEDEEATEETHPIENWKQAVQQSLKGK